MAQNFRMTGRLPNESMIAMDEITISRGFRSKRQEQTPKNRLPPNSDARARFALLTPRERQIMALVTGGLMNKQVAGKIGISERTVKIHRGNVMRKMRTKSLADLVMIAESLGIRGKENQES